MNSHIWKIIYAAIREVNRQIGPARRRCAYPDTLILAMFMWSVGHDRPRCWAAQRSSYYGPFRPHRLPSRSQFMRRINSPRCQAMLAALHKQLAGHPQRSQLAFVDGHALPVRRHSTDADARVGRGVGGMARGYKLHAYITGDGRISYFRVTPLNVCEKKMAHGLLLEAQPNGVILGDAMYDDAKLFEAARRSGGRFIAPPRDGAGRGHVPQSPARLEAIARWPEDEALHQKRRNVERYFGQLTCFGGGLAPLPAWVRTLPRVRMWVTAKIILYHARLQIRSPAA
jgi:prepilin-type processing-associated H-X9-DG protein